MEHVFRMVESARKCASIWQPLVVLIIGGITKRKLLDVAKYKHYVLGIPTCSIVFVY